MNTNEAIKVYLCYLTDFLIQKNNDYGDSLQNPISIFQQNKIDGILGRIDDKLNRIKTVGLNDKTEDTIEDLIGYLIHLKLMINEEN
jgi:low affinity Fe/Cu permease